VIRDWFGGRSRETIPLFPLATVLFPEMRLPLKVFEQRYVDMTTKCFKEGGQFGVCLIREGPEVGGPAVPEGVGSAAKIVDFDVEQLGILKVVVQGTQRFRIVETDTTPQGLVVAVVEPLAAEAEAHDAPGLKECADFLAKVITGIGAARFAQPLRYDDATWVGFRLAEILPLRNDVRQKMLELTDGAMRLAVLHRFLRQQKLIA
jgi:uncharacterized protein